MNIQRISQITMFILGTWVTIGLLAQMDIGLADNGDFTRAMTVFTSKPVGFEINWPDPTSQGELWSKRFFYKYIPYWVLDEPQSFSLKRPFKSTIYLLWYPGVIINKWFWDRNTLNLAIMSLPQRLGLIFWYWLLLRWLARRFSSYSFLLLLGLGIPLGLMLLSPYTFYLNSFYYESAGLIFFLILLSWLVFLNSVSWPFIKSALTALPLAFLLGASKAQWFYWPILSVVAVIAIRSACWKQRTRLNWKQIVLVVVIGIVASVLCLFVAQPADYALTNNAYHRFFLGVLQISVRSEQHLLDFGTPDAIECVGVDVYTKIGGECLTRFRGILGWKNFLKILSKEPILLPKMFAAAAGHMHVIKVDYLGIFAENDPRSQIPTLMDIWPKIKALFPRRWPLYTVWLLICATVCWIALCRNTEMAPIGTIGITAIVGSVVDMLAAFVGEGFRDLGKHLFLANITFDIGSICALSIAFVSFINSAIQVIKLINQDSTAKTHRLH